ncbi:hypothetical protein [Dyella silvatica]|uniref:hypothetical protein n=1 Tax=Dyella silvatica TaxID=2992128 RepID=UPI00225308B0|nr:hypothetical protein [Dyella silvatica]
MSRTDKREAQLEATEGLLLALLEQVLPRIVDSGEMLFYHADFMPLAEQARWLPPECEVLLPLVKDSMVLRHELGLAVSGSMGELYLSACREAADVDNEHRRGPRRLAAWLLGELDPGMAFKRLR